MAGYDQQFSVGFKSIQEITQPRMTTIMHSNPSNHPGCFFSFKAKQADHNISYAGLAVVHHQ